MAEYIVDSKIFGEKIRVVSDDQVVDSTQSDLVIYTESEVRLMSKRPLPDELLKQIHLVKQIFPGATVVP